METENTETVHSEFEALFQYKGLLFFEEMASIFFTPFILFFCLLKCVDDVLRFVQDFSVHIEGVGHVCSLSVFDFEHHGNPKYGSPYQTSKDRRSSQGKMEKSFLSFKGNYPNWEPDGKANSSCQCWMISVTRMRDLRVQWLRSFHLYAYPNLAIN